jgi:DNA-binding NarL/FixJ family response regulator
MAPPTGPPRTGLAAVSAALLAMNRTLEVRDVLQTIVGSARELLHARYAALGVPDGAGGFAQFIVDGVSERQWKAIGPLPRQHEAADGAEGVARATELSPDVVLMDVKMPGTGGIEALLALREQHNPARVLIVTSFAEQRTVVPAVRAGAAGYLHKDIDPLALARAIRSAHSGHVLLQPEVAQALLAQDTAGSGRTGHLTDRGREVLGLIARGRSNREIARSLTLSEKTVRTHVSNILMKLDLADRTQAALWAVRHGISD